MEALDRSALQRLFAPRHIAVFGGRAAAEVLRQCRNLGFLGELWPVHPRHAEIEGLRCFVDVAALPAAPDANFIAVPREATLDVVGALAARGAGGVVCYASGFAEVGADGAALQRQLVQHAGGMALLGPNCYGMLNYLDGVALWPDQHGGARVERGVAIVTQSGNIGLNLTMQRRHLPLAMLITVGNKAGASLEAIVDALLQDARITAIGLHVEGLDDVPAFSRVALRALAQGVPLVALKAGSSELGARTTMSHTSSLAGPDHLYDVLFARCGVARVPDPAALLETLKLLHVQGPLAGRRIASASCSGGEASLVADLAQPRGLQMPPPPEDAHRLLHAALGDKVAIANPLDYHTYIWGDLPAQTQCFGGLLACGFDMHLLVLDFPRADRCGAKDWHTTLQAFAAAKAAHRGAAAAVVASLPEGMPDDAAQWLLARGIAPMQGIAECLDAIARAADIGVAEGSLAQRQPVGAVPLLPPTVEGALRDEVASKALLSHHGLRVPHGAVVTDADAAVAFADAIGYPVVAKVVSATLAHKTEAGGVRLHLRDAAELREAVAALQTLAPQCLVEQMVPGTVAEIIVGVHRDLQFGLALTLGAGGIFVELLRDTATLLLPATREQVFAALKGLRVWPLLQGFRGRAGGDVPALLDAVMAVQACAQAESARLMELDVNPLLVLPPGQGVVAVDAVLLLAAQP